MKTRKMDDASVWLRDTLFIVRGGETGGDWQIRPECPGIIGLRRCVYTRIRCSAPYGIMVLAGISIKSDEDLLEYLLNFQRND